MLLTDVWRLDSFLVRHPPVDMLVAGWMKYEPPAERGSNVVDIREAAKHNRQAMASLPVQLQPRVGKLPTLDKMPAFLRAPEHLAMIERVRANAG